jgi:hypothetical protein
MDYNTQRGEMMYREYGRSIEKLVQNVCLMPDDEKKNEAAKAIVYSMSIISGTSIKDDLSYHKLWDHLMILSSFRLESSWPYSTEELDKLKERASSEDVKLTEHIPYRDTNIRIRQYGANLDAMMCRLKEMPFDDEYCELVTLIAEQTKRSYLAWNGEISDDSIIVDHVARLSEDERVREVMKDKKINVLPGSIPTDIIEKKKKRRKK